MNTKFKMIPMNLTVTFPLGNDKNSLADLKQLLFSKTVFERDSDDFKHSILNTDVGQRANDLLSEYLSAHPDRILKNEKIFHEFKKRHTSMNYSLLFKQNETANSFFSRRKRSKGKIVYRDSKPSLKNQAHPALIRERCATIMHRVITPEIFGNDRNKKKILKSLFRLMQTAATEPFSLLPLVEQINTESITWLIIEDEKLKLIFVAKLLKWLFRFFVLLICKYFSITHIKYERVFSFIKDLNKEIKRDLVAKNKKGVLEECPVKNIDSIKTRMYMMPKDEGFRTITRRKYTSAEKQSLRKVVSVLTFLFNEFIKIPGSSFNDAYIGVTTLANNSSKKCYITATDIRDAFGSIIQRKLFDILTSLFEHLPEIVELTEFYQRGGNKYVYGFPMFLKDRHGNKKSGTKVIAKKSKILEILEKTIFNTKVKIHNKVYNICKGVAQGSILSSRLSDIYYGSMQQKYFADFRGSGRIFSHVDDIIYFTTNEESAKQFLNRIQKGIPEYNCWFKQSKIVSNFAGPSDGTGLSHGKNINFLGWSIDSRTLELEPYVKFSMRYSMMHSALSNSEKLNNRLSNMESIKVNKPTLHKSINSNNKILNNIKVIARLQANRCFAIANSLHNYTDMTFEIIDDTNLKIIKKIQKLTTWTQMEKLKYRSEIKYIFWKSYYTVFIKKKHCFLHLIKKFKEMMGKSNPHKKQKKLKLTDRPFYSVPKRARYM